jgi:hypothetical protein
MSRIFIFFSLFFVLLQVNLFAQIPKFDYEMRKVKIGNNELILEVADDYYKRAYGLMYRESISFGRGMLFIHDKELKNA